MKKELFNYLCDNFSNRDIDKWKSIKSISMGAQKRSAFDVQEKISTNSLTYIDSTPIGPAFIVIDMSQNGISFLSMCEIVTVIPIDAIVSITFVTNK